MTETICQIGCIMVTGTRLNPEGISLKVFCHTCYELKFAIVYLVLISDDIYPIILIKVLLLIP